MARFYIIYTHRCIHIYCTHAYTHMYIYIHTCTFFRFFSMIGYCKILNIAPYTTVNP